MAASRRDFLKTAAGLPAMVMAAAMYGDEHRLTDDVEETRLLMRDHVCQFNMHRYAAPALPTLRVGYIGMGGRGYASMGRLSQMEGVEIKALCDSVEPQVSRAVDYLKEAGLPEPAVYTGSEDAWKDLIARDDLDLVYVTSPQYWHAEMVCSVMEAGKHAACEIPLAYTLADCWKIIQTSERTKKQCALLENCCFDFFESMAINMALQGKLGEVVYGEGAYIHWMNPEALIAGLENLPVPKAGAYRHITAATAHGNRYPTHGFGPVALAMRINAGDRPLYLTSTETDDFVWARAIDQAIRAGNKQCEEFVGKPFNGNLNVSTMKTAGGKMIQIQYGITSPRPYTRKFILSGLKGFVQKYPEPSQICLEGGVVLPEEEAQRVQEENTPELIKNLRELALRFGGHGGIDFTCDYQLVDSLRNGLPLNISVYDGVTWSALTPLSLWSVTHGSQPIDYPDFTGGTWKENAPIDLSARGAMTTKVNPR